MTAAKIAGLLLSPESPRVAAPFCRKVSPDALRDFARTGMDIAEIRLDLAGAESPQAASDLARSFRGVPTIATARAGFEGGAWKGDEFSRRDALLAALEFADAVDIELAAEGILSSVVAAARGVGGVGKTVIISRHNFSGMDSPERMSSALSQAREEGADIFKIACAVGDESDAETLLEFVRKNKSFPLIATAMGENPIARRARLDLARNGSVIAFASADGKSAPGQLTLSETLKLL